MVIYGVASVSEEGRWQTWLHETWGKFQYIWNFESFCLSQSDRFSFNFHSHLQVLLFKNEINKSRHPTLLHDFIQVRRLFTLFSLRELRWQKSHILLWAVNTPQIFPFTWTKLHIKNMSSPTNLLRKNAAESKRRGSISQQVERRLLA